MSLILTCRRCGAETPKLVGLGICPACGVRDALTQYQPEVLRLLRKRERYDRAGLALSSIDQQMAALIRRAMRKGLDIDPSASPVIDRWFEELQAQARGFSRIIEVRRA